MTTPTTSAWPRRSGSAALFLVALVVAAAWGSLVQTQFNLQALAALDVPIPFDVRLRTSLQDLAGFGPVYAGLVLAAWLPAFAAAALLARGLGRGTRIVLFALAGGLGLVAAVRIADAFAPMPVLIDATRGTGGLVAMALGSALGGALFAALRRPAAVRR